MLLLSGCNSKQKTTDIYMYTEDNMPPYVKGLEDIIDTHGELENKERFNDFLNNVQQGKADNIRVVKYTTEGAPIIYDYEFEKDMIKVTIDTRRDDYGQKEIFHTICTSIEMNKATKKTEYALKGCVPLMENNMILDIEK